MEENNQKPEIIKLTQQVRDWHNHDHNKTCFFICSAPNGITRSSSSFLAGSQVKIVESIVQVCRSDSDFKNVITAAAEALNNPFLSILMDEMDKRMKGGDK